MRRGLIDQLIKLLTDVFRSGSQRNRSAGSGSSVSHEQPSPSKRTKPRRGEPATPPPSPDGEAPARDIEPTKVVFEYSPCLDGDPDPGEVVWTWVPYEEDPTQGKDRPVVIIGRRGGNLVGVPLTSKQHDNEPQVPVGTGPWDREGRPSYAKLDRVLEVDPEQVRREGAVLSRAHFDDVIAGVQREQSR
ncbi:MAG: type II toxin-antitoxin system PemK/MazF family toxin [Ilumatobacteraceae bacterium]